MRVSFEHQLQRDLVRAYRTSSQTLVTATDELSPLVSEAAALLGQPRPPAAEALAEVSNDLRLDALDLELRANFVIEADARLATLLSTTVGQIVDVGLAAVAIRRGWSYWEAELRARLAELLGQPRDQQLRAADEIRRLDSILRIIEAPRTTIGVLGDRDQNQRDLRIGPPLDVEDQDPLERGRQLLLRAIRDTADPDRILADEFEAILHDNGQLTIILPGVIDLSEPWLGLDPAHESTRDLDQVAWPSSYNTSLDDNEYGRRVRDWIRWLVDNDAVAPGTPTVIIGHSFGAETAIDLAADPEINGELIEIAHVIPTGYHNEPLLDDVPAHTEVVVLQNIWDAVIFGEAFTDEARRAYPGNRSDHETSGIVARAGVEGLELVSETVVDEAADWFELAVDRLPGVDIDTPPVSIEYKGDDYREHSDNVLIVEFEGGFEGFGHHQDNYIEFLEQTDHPEMVSLLTTIAEQGFTQRGTAVSVDVTRRTDESDDSENDDR